MTHLQKQIHKTMEIPVKSWNAMEGKMEDSNLPQWQKYYADLEAHNALYAGRKPIRATYSDEAEYQKAFDKWCFDEAMSAPNKPGYYRANND